VSKRRSISTKKKGKKKMSSLKNLSTETQEIKRQIKKMAEDKVSPALKAAFAELKAVLPALQAIRWRQYTPYFNDGDTCEFGVYEIYFRLETSTEDAGDYSDGFESTYDMDLTKEQDKAIDDFAEGLNGIEDLLQEALGDHAEITLNAKSIEVEQYEHD